MNAISVRKEATARGGRYVATIQGVAGEAELIFTHRGDGLISADHTEAPYGLRGTGAARALVERMVVDARSQGLKIWPRCSYVMMQFEKNGDWRDVLAGDAE